MVQCLLHFDAIKKQLKGRHITFRIVLLEHLKTTASATLVRNIDHPHELEMTDTDIFANRQLESTLHN